MKNRLRWIVGTAIAIAGFAAMPARADLSVGVTLGGPAYYYEPAPRYYEREVVYERPVVRYYEPRYYESTVVYERDYYPPPRRYYHRGRYYRHHAHGRYWD